MNMSAIRAILVSLFLLTSCELSLEMGVEHSTNGTPTPTTTIQLTSTIFLTPTHTSSSTPSATPEATATQTSTSTPEGLIFHDDFSGTLQEGWTWTNEDSTRWIITEDGWLQIIGQDASILKDNGNNLLCRAAPSADYQVTVHLYAEPWADFMAASLFILQDTDNYVSINRGFCGPCLPGGGGFFLEYMMNGSLGVSKIATQDPDVYLRLVNKDSAIKAYYALDDENWQLLGTVGNFVKNPRICLTVSNNDHTRSINSDLIGKFDYITISKP